MKKHIYFIILSILIMGSCCKNPYAIAAVSVTYTNLESSSTLKAYLTDRNDLSSIKDTLILSYLSEVNNYTASIEFSENSPNYILFIEGSTSTDTLTDIYYIRKPSRCKETIEDFQYRFNGKLTSSPRLTIE